MAVGRVPVERWSRTIAVLCLLSMVAGGIGEAWVPGQLIVRHDAAATVHNLTTSNLLYRLGFAAYLIEAICDIMLALAFYVILRPVHRNIALMAAFFGVLSTSIFAVAEGFYMLPALVLRNPAPFGAFTPDQLNALMLLSLRAYGYIGSLFMVTYGVATVLRGWLMYRSGYLPAWLGVLLMAGGLGFMASSFVVVLAPARATMLFGIPMFAALLAMTLWFAVKGVDVEVWRRLTDRAPAA